MKKMLRRSALREIRSSFGRFFAILAIIALGVGFFAGVRITTPAMVNTVDLFMQAYKLYDYRLLSTLGWEEDNVRAFAKQADVAAAEGAYAADILYLRQDDSEIVLKTHSLTQNVNTLRLQSGRLPEKAGECVVDARMSELPELGEALRISQDTPEDTLEMFSPRTLKVVGTVDSPLYLNYERGTTSIGNGSVSGFVYVLPSDFSSDYFTEIWVRFRHNHMLYSDAYDEMIDQKQDAWEKLTEEQAQAHYETLRHDAQEKIEDGQKELDEKRADGQKELDDAAQELHDARTELHDARTELRDAQKELAENQIKLDDAQKELDENKQKLDDAAEEISSSEEELKNAAQELDDAKQELETAQAQVDEGQAQIDKNRADLEAAQAQLDEGAAQLDAAEQELHRNEEMLAAQAAQLDAAQAELETQRSTLDAQLAALTPMLDVLPPEQLEPLYAAQAQIDAAQAQINEGRVQLAAAAQQLSAGRAELEAQRRTLNEGRAQTADGAAQLAAAQQELDAAKKQIEDGLAAYEEGLAQYEEGLTQFEEGKAAYTDGLAQWTDGRAEFEDGLEKWTDGKAQVEDGLKEYHDGLQSYLDGLFAYQDGLQEFQNQIYDAQKTIDDAREELNSLEEPDSYVLGRNTNIGIACFENDSDIVAQVAGAFPIFFILVAALVCITTMSRMVEEQRTQIGTLKALGYGNGAIMGKFLLYSCSAALIGCLVGYAGGTVIFPYVIWFTYQMMYIPLKMPYYFSAVYLLLSLAASLACAAGTTCYACSSILRGQAAELMRPKAPKAGKRVWLEYIPFIWNRMKFLQKVSFRNIFRYKQRFFMMVIGIGGCTALLLTGFGIKDSIGDFGQMQYGEIQVADLSVVCKDEYDQTPPAVIRSSGAEILPMREETRDLIMKDGEKSINLLIPQSWESFDTFMHLHTPEGEALTYPRQGEALVSESMHTRYGVDVGDKVSLRDEDFHSFEVTVSGIFENHVYNYVLVDTSSYPGEMRYNSAYLVYPEQTDIYAAAAKIAGDEAINSVVVFEEIASRMSNMMSSLDYIVLLVILSAAGLAFVVLYNLTNINITERTREIATIKVLGFFRRETSAYVLRENITLTVIGAGVGLVLGIFLHRFCMSRIVVDMVSFRIQILPLSFLWSVLLTFLFGIAVNLFMGRKLEHINMAESLKSVD